MGSGMFMGMYPFPQQYGPPVVGGGGGGMYGYGMRAHGGAYGPSPQHNPGYRQESPRENQKGYGIRASGSTTLGEGSPGRATEGTEKGREESQMNAATRGRFHGQNPVPGKRQVKKGSTSPPPSSWRRQSSVDEHGDWATPRKPKGGNRTTTTFAS
jgi:hypothetical protein